MPAQTQTGGVQAATWNTAYVDALPNSSFAYVSGDVRKLPYKDKDGKVDLPHVRNALARLNQTQGIPDDEKPKVKTKLQNALKSAKADGLDANDFHLNQTHSLQADGTTGTTELPTRMMLLRSGQFDPPKYWPFEITADDLHEMKDNFELGIGLPGDGSKGMPIDFGHKSGEKAAGWVKQLEVVANDDGAELWGTNLTWSTSGKAAVLGDEYGYTSSDFWPRDWPSEWQSSEQAGLTAHNVIRGVALTNVPMFEGNEGLTASNDGKHPEGVHADATHEPGVDFVFVNKPKEKSMNLDELRVKAAADLSGPEALHIAAHASELSDDERKKFGLQASTEETAEQKTAREAEEKKKQEEEAAKAATAAGSTGSVQADAIIKQLQEQNKSMQAAVDTLTAQQKNSEHEKIQKEVEAHAARGAIKPDQIETLVTSIEASDEKTSKVLLDSLSALASNPLLGRQFGSGQTQGSAAEDVEAEILKKATELVASSEKAGTPMTIFAARKQVLASDPALDLRATQAVQASAAGFDPFAASWGTNASGLQGVNPEAFK